MYLSKTYSNLSFQVSEKINEGEKNIILKTVSGEKIENDEQFQIFGEGNELNIQGRTQRAVFNGVYGLLKEIGWSFYLSFEVPPSTPKPFVFSDFQISNSPLKEKRIIFNWHNFMSGCSSWDLEQWEKWIDNSSRIGFNTVMVHAYGNNPIQSFSFNGKEKEIGYLTTSLKGRDNGAQHVNDVRLMHGGEIYSDYVFGAKAAKVPDENRRSAATSLMQKVFKHADKKEMDVCFAIDLDTWMANPQNIINTLPKESLLQVSGYNVVNPEHPDGRKYYMAQLEKLLSDYPEISMLAAWIRNPYIGINSPVSIWFNFDSNQLPETWRKEYFEILKQHPEFNDENPFPGLYAISKVLETYREILDELRPDVELTLGSWRYNICKYADPFIPDFCGLMPLDYDIVLGTPVVLKELEEVGANRRLYPIAWAHHDDHRYLGRPYKPWANLASKLDKINAPGFGIIHWTTHPLDLYFTNSANQVWQNSKNEGLGRTIESYAESLLKSKDENLHLYFQRWFTDAPMFGRETSQDFIPVSEDYQLDGYTSALEVVEKARKRLELLENVNIEALNEQGRKEYQYQVGMEKFIISFFENHHNIHSAYTFIDEGKITQSIPFIKKTLPEESIEIYANTISDYGATKGEKGVLITLNLQWLPDYIDVKQRAGLEPLRVNFQPTSHDPLARGAGKYTFFIDDEKNYWNSLGEQELGIQAKTNGAVPLKKLTDSWIEINSPVTIPLQTMRNFNLPEGKYSLKLLFVDGGTKAKVKVSENGSIVSMQMDKGILIESKGNNMTMEIYPDGEKLLLAGMIISPENF